MRLLGAIVCGLALWTTGASAQGQSLAELIKTASIAWNKPTEPFTVIGNIHYVGTDGLAVYLITTPEGHILIDTAMPEATAQIKASIAKLGFKLSDIKILINTHAHIDHTGGLAELKKDTGAQMISGLADKPLLEGGYYPGRETAVELKFPALKVDRTVVAGDTVSLGGVTLTAHATPGHSPGCTSWAMNVADGSATRSIIFFCSATVALNELVGAPTHAGIVDDYRKTYAWARTIKPDVLLAPHPDMYGMAAKRAKIAPGAPNPFVVPGEFNAYLAKLETLFDEGLAKQTAALAAKK